MIWNFKGRVDEISSVIARPEQILVRIHDINGHRYKGVQLSVPIHEIKDLDVHDVIEMTMSVVEKCSKKIGEEEK